MHPDKPPTLIARIANAGRALAGAEVRASAPKMLEVVTASGVLPDGQITATLPLRTGSAAGSLDPNTALTPRVLYGDTTSPGTLWQIRVTDDVVQPAMDSRRELLMSLDYDIVPPRRFEHDPDAIASAAGVGALMYNMHDRTVPYWVAESYDYFASIGHVLYQMRMDEGRLRMAYIRRGLIDRWEPDATGYRWAKAWVKTRQGVTQVHAGECAYFARNPLPGQFDGTSAFRCLVAPSTLTYELYKLLLETMAFSRGFMHVHPPFSGDGGQATANDNENIQEFFDSLAAGDVPPAITTSRAIEFQPISSQAGPMANFAPLAQHSSESKNRVALNALNNLGMRGVGSRSLGEVVHEADQAHLHGHLDAFMDVLSGDNQPNGTMMRVLTDLAGYAGAPTPRIIVRWSDKAKRLSADHIRLVADLVDRKILRATPELSEYVARGSGMPDGVVESQTARAEESTAEPLAVGSLQVALQVLQALKPADPTLAPIAPAAAVQLLTAAGVDADTARTMIAAQGGADAPTP